MANEVMMTLGQFQFSVGTAAYQEFNRTTEYRWPAQDLIMQDAALQFVGRGEDSITLPGVIYPYFRGGLGQLDAMRAMAANGQPLTLMNGQGKVMGQWVITRVEEKQTVFAHAGTPRKQEFTLGLRYFGAVGSAARRSLENAASIAASADATKIAQGPLPMLTTLTTTAGSQAGGFAASLAGHMAAINAQAAQIGAGVQSVLAPVSSAMEAANNLKRDAANAKRMLGSIPTTVAGIKAATGLRNGAAITVNNATAAGAMLQRRINELTGAPAAAVSSVRGAMLTVNNLAVTATKVHADASAMLKGLIA